MINYCEKCKVRIRNHLWIIDGKIYCGASCQRGGKSQFDKLYRALRAQNKQV